MAYVQRCWRAYEVPALGRTPESFAFKVEELDYNNVTDVLYTDDPAEAERLRLAMIDQGYDARITSQTTNKT